jgi:hypothetical protein
MVIGHQFDVGAPWTLASAVGPRVPEWAQMWFSASEL